MSDTPSFERFTERARQVVVLAKDEAKTLKHNYIGTEHILLGLLREEEGLAAHILGALSVTTEKVREQVLRIVGPSDSEPTDERIPFTPRAKKVLELALREALALGHNYIGTEHILLGLVRENEGVAARILFDFDADAEKIRNEIIHTLSGLGRRRSEEPAEQDVVDLQAAHKQIDEAESVLAQIRTSLTADRFVEAEAWAETLRRNTFIVSHLLGKLAAGERGRVRGER